MNSCTKRQVPPIKFHFYKTLAWQEGGRLHLYVSMSSGINICRILPVLLPFQLDTGKTPGNDGIPAEFYKTFWNSVGVFMTEVFNHSFVLEQMSNSQQQAVITLIDKKGKDRMFWENWRPISLINVGSKIATKVIANRIKNVLPGIIHSNQSGSMKGRFIGQTARSILDIIAHTEAFKKLPGVLFFIDFEKAFDSIEHNFLYKALERFNFGPSFIRWIQTFYNNLSSCVLNNGFFLFSFSI